MNKLKYSFLLLLALLVSTCLDDPIELTLYGTVEGIVTSLEDDLPMAGVNITTTPTSRSVTTDEDGYFFLDSVPVNNYSFRFRKDGFKDETLVVNLEEVADVSLEVFMGRDYGSNLPPNLPSNPEPADGSEIFDLSVLLKWTGTDPDPEDSLLYDLIFYRGSGSGEQLLREAGQDSLLVEDLVFGTNYSWQVIAYDGENDPVYGPVWQFSVRERPAMPMLFVRRQDAQWQVWMSSLDGEMSRLYETFPNAWRPKRSPVGDRIAFLAFVGTEAHLFTSDEIGENIRQVTTVPVGGYDLQEVSYAWSPTGDQLLYPSFDKLYRVNLDGTGLTEITTAPFGRIFEGVAWSQFNDVIVVRTQGSLPYENEIYRVTYPDGTLQMLVSDLTGTVGNPALSINGEQMLYSHDLSGLEVESGRQNNASVLLTTLANPSTSTNISADKPNGYNDLDPQFSPTEGEAVVTYWINTEGAPPDIVSISLTDLTSRTVLVTNGRTHDWRE